MHTCSHTPLALAAKQKQTFPVEEVTTGQLLPDPVEGLLGTKLRVRPGSELCREHHALGLLFPLSDRLLVCTNPRAAC